MFDTRLKGTASEPAASVLGLAAENAQLRRDLTDCYERAADAKAATARVQRELDHARAELAVWRQQDRVDRLAESVARLESQLAVMGRAPERPAGGDEPTPGSAAWPGTMP